MKYLSKGPFKAPYSSLFTVREIGGVGPRAEEHQHFSHLTILPSQVDLLTFWMNSLEF